VVQLQLQLQFSGPPPVRCSESGAAQDAIPPFPPSPDPAAIGNLQFELLFSAGHLDTSLYQQTPWTLVLNLVVCKAIRLLTVGIAEASNRLTSLDWASSVSVMPSLVFRIPACWPVKSPYSIQKGLHGLHAVPLRYLTCHRSFI